MSEHLIDPTAGGSWAEATLPIRTNGDGHDADHTQPHGAATEPGVAAPEAADTEATTPTGSYVEVSPADGAPAPEVLADTEADEMDDEPLLELPPGKARRSPATLALLGVLLAAVGFLAGVLVQKHEQPAAASSTNPFAALAAAARAQGAGGTGATGATGANGQGAGTGAGGAAGGGAGGSAAGRTVGTVKLVDGVNVYVQTASGDVVKVITTPDTRITVTKAGTTADLQAGTNVIVQGQAGSDGNVSATAVTSLGAGTGGGFGGGFAGAGGATGGGAAGGQGGAGGSAGAGQP